MIGPLIVGPVSGLFETLGLPGELAMGLAQVTIFVITLLILYYAGRGTALPLINRMLRNRGVEEHARKPLVKLSRIVMLFAVVGIAFGLAGFGNFLTAIAAIGAAATLAVGFAMQNVIRNFVAGLFIFIEQPFRINDWIEWEGNAGVVEDISLRVTRVRTFDNELLTVPNSELTDNVIKNPVAKDRLRLRVPFGISYEDDIDKAMEIIIDEAESHDRILEEPSPSVRLTDLGDSDVVIQSRVWISNPSRGDFMQTRSDYVKGVKEQFDREGIDIPYPHRHLVGGIETENRTVTAEPASGAAANE